MAFNKAKALQEAEKLVSQGKTSQAIKQYAYILEKDPSDLTLLNTIGDLYIRDKNIPQALTHFHKLADAYSQEGFTVKAIAIYRKIIKLETASAEPLIKLADLYMLQGLSREARDHYAQAVDFYKKKNQIDKALGVFRKIVSLDPENANFRLRFAEFCEQAGKKEEAALAYCDTAEVALRRSDLASAEAALKRAAELDTRSHRMHLLRARVAFGKKDWGQVEKVLESVPAVKATVEGRRLLLEAYLAGGKREEAEKLVTEIFELNPSDFAPLGSFVAMCVERGDLDAAVIPLAAAADALIAREETAPLVDSLRQIWAKDAQHRPTLEVLYRVYEGTGDEFALPEVMHALGRAYLEAGQLEEAETLARKLVNRSPENEQYQSLLNHVLQRQGKEVEVPAPAAALPAGFELEIPVEPAPAPSPAPAPAVAGEEATLVKEALDNSDLFARYGLVDKAVAELDKVLALYPDQTEVHERIREICHRGMPERAREAAEALARIHTERGELAKAKRYDTLARGGFAGAPAEEVPSLEAPEEVVTGVGAPEPASAEIDLSSVFPVGAPQAPAAEEPPPEAAEFDLSTDLDAFAQVAETPVAAPEVPAAPPEVEAPPPEVAIAPPEAPAFDYEESRVEIDFYLEQGLVEEARSAVEALEEQHPGNAIVGELRQRVERRVAAREAPLEVSPPPPVEAPPPPVEPAQPEWELPTGFAGEPPAEAPPLVAPEAPPFEPPPPPPAPEPVAAGGDLLGDLAGELAASLEGVEAPRGPAPEPSVGQAPPQVAAGGEGASGLSSLLEELGEPVGAEAAQDDPETHYNLGVAFREMNLLDEAIGEFQKVLKGAQKGNYPPNFLQACSLLAVCFMDKGMPTIAAKWYARALETPDLDDEGTMALQYDLGVAFETAGDPRTALEKFSEVYAQNIDYRDVAEKVRQLQQKAH